MSPEVEIRLLELIASLSRSPSVFSFSSSEVSSAIYNLVKGRAAGPDLLVVEHVVYGPLQELVECLSSLFNATLTF